MKLPELIEAVVAGRMTPTDALALLESRTIMYHGSSEASLRTILKNGLVPTPPRRVYATGELESFEGVYVTNHIPLAIRYSNDAKRKTHTNQVVYTLTIETATALPDEDNIPSISSLEMAKSYGFDIWRMPSSDADSSSASEWLDDRTDEFIQLWASHLKHEDARVWANVKPHVRAMLAVWLDKFKQLHAVYAKVRDENEATHKAYFAKRDEFEKANPGTDYDAIAAHVRDTPEEKAYYQASAKVDAARKEFEHEWYEWRRKERADPGIRKALDAIAKATRLITTKRKYGGIHTMRLPYPVGFRGANRIISAMMFNEEKVEARAVYGPWNQDVVRQFAQLEGGEWMEKYGKPRN